MANVPGIFAALGAGLLSFLSPCVLPLIPSYLSMLTGSSVTELRGNGEGSPGAAGVGRLSIAGRSIAFVAGFTVVFVVLGVVLSSSAAMLGGASRTVSIVAGAVIVVLGLNVIFDFAKFLNFEARVHSGKKPAGLVGSFLFGTAFAAGWSPCVGPLLASILALAGSGAPGRAALLLTVYSLGLGLPFLAFGLFFARLEGVLGAIKRHMGAVKLVSGAFLILVGVAMLLGTLQGLNGVFLRWAYGLAEFQQRSSAAARTIMIAVYIVASGLGPTIALLRRKPLLRPSILVPAALFLVLAILESLRILSTLGLLSSWLLYQGA